MKLRDLNPKVGDRIKLVRSDRDYDSTVIAFDSKDNSWMLGWMPEETAPFGASNNLNDRYLDPRRIETAIVLPGIEKYQTNNWYYGGQEVEMVSVGGASTMKYIGMNCSNRYCNSFVSMAAPNMPDRTFLCYSCRSLPLYMIKK